MDVQKELAKMTKHIHKWLYTDERELVLKIYGHVSGDRILALHNLMTENGSARVKTVLTIAKLYIRSLEKEAQKIGEITFKGRKAKKLKDDLENMEYHLQAVRPHVKSGNDYHVINTLKHVREMKEAVDL